MDSPENIIKTLTKAGYSQKNISAHTGISQPTINKIVKGVTKNTRWQTVEALKSFLDTVNNFDDENI